MPPLDNQHHEAFARAIAEGASGRLAYRQAGYVKGTDAPADANSSRLLKNDKVKARVLELKEEAARTATITVSRVLEELGKIAFSNMADYVRFGRDGDMQVDFSKLTRDQAAALVEVTIDDIKVGGRGEEPRDARRIRFKLADKRAALVDIGKFLGMFRDRVDARVGVVSMDLTPPAGEITDTQRIRALSSLFAKVKAKGEAE